MHRLLTKSLFKLSESIRESEEDQRKYDKHQKEFSLPISVNWALKIRKNILFIFSLIRFVIREDPGAAMHLANFFRKPRSSFFLPFS